MTITQILAGRLAEALNQIYAQKTRFFVVFFVIFMLTYGALVVIDFIPEKPEMDAEKEVVADASQPILASEVMPPANTDAIEQVDTSVSYPVRIFIDSLERDATVLNPKSSTIADLDTALLEGVVRHPDSALLGEDGTVFLFGHSSYLPKVYNKNFQAFNGLQKLSWGDTIRVQSDDVEYIYAVQKVYKTKAENTTVSLQYGSPMLTLVTCNSFGSKDDRFVVEAKLVKTKAI